MSSAAPTSSPSPSSVAQATSGSSLSPPSSSSSSARSSTPPPASNTPTSSSTVNAPTTSATPTSSSTPATTAQSSPAQTSSSAGRTSTASPTASASAALSSTAAPQTTSASSFTSQIATTFSSTDPAGSVVYITSTVPQVFTTSVVSAGSGGGSSNNTGVIVGSVVGGVVGTALLALLLFCIRRRVRRDDFDGNFDPDRVVGHSEGGGTLPQVDLADEVTPFPQHQSYTDQDSSSVRQYGKSPYIPVSSPLGASVHGSTEFFPSGAGMSTVDTQPRTFVRLDAGAPSSGAYIPPINMYGTGPVDWYTPHPGASPPPSTVSNTTASARAAKEREAIGRGGQGTGLALATQPEVAEGSGDVVVHQDAGRAPIEEHAPPREIPPSYDSIRRD